MSEDHHEQEQLPEAFRCPECGGWPSGVGGDPFSTYEYAICRDCRHKYELD